MAKIKFDVPDDIKEAFEKAIAEEDRNATISRLMLEAVDERRRQQQRATAIEALLDLRSRQRSVSAEEVARAGAFDGFEPEANAETAWRQEVADRVAALDDGAVETTSWREIRDHFLARLSKRNPD